MYMDGVSAAAMLDPGHEELAPTQSAPAHEPVAHAFGVGLLVTLTVRHSFLDLTDRDPLGHARCAFGWRGPK
jgi:hypothetical protein